MDMCVAWTGRIETEDLVVVHRAANDSERTSCLERMWTATRHWHLRCLGGMGICDRGSVVNGSGTELNSVYLVFIEFRSKMK